MDIQKIKYEFLEKFKYIIDEYGETSTGEENLTKDLDDIWDFIESSLTKAVEEEREETFKKVGSWHKVPIRKGMKTTKNIDGTGGLMSAGCEVCGGKLVFVRGRYPGDKKRKTCPTCALEIIESILDNCNNRQAYTESNH